jgi:hypothetical protein
LHFYYRPLPCRDSILRPISSAGRPRRQGKPKWYFNYILIIILIIILFIILIIILFIILIIILFIILIIIAIIAQGNFPLSLIF